MTMDNTGISGPGSAPVAAAPPRTRFQGAAEDASGGPVRALALDTLQVSTGPRCNLSCKHCHVSGGPGRTEEMNAGTALAVLAALASSPATATLDITGGAPEMSPVFRMLVEGARAIGRRVVVRSNLTLLSERDYAWVAPFLRASGAEVVASLPYYGPEAVDRVRGSGVFMRSIEALALLNSLGIGTGTAPLSLVYNPPGAFLAPPQTSLEAEYRERLASDFGVRFDALYTFSNMPIGRFREFLARAGAIETYMKKLIGAFNPATLCGIMCRRLVSVGHDGLLHDCDFNLALEMGLAPGLPRSIEEFDHERLADRPIMLGDHCYACTAGQGST